MAREIIRIEDSKSVTGLGYGYVGILEKDTPNEVRYSDSILELSNIKNFSIEEEQSIEKNYGSNRVVESAQVRNGATFTLELTNYPKELMELVDGAEVTENGTYVYRNSDKTPEVGFVGVLTREDGNDLYIGASKVVFSRSNDSGVTKEDGVEFQSITLEGEVFEREYDKVKKFKGSKLFSPDFTFEGFLDDVFKNEVREGYEPEEEGE